MLGHDRLRQARSTGRLSQRPRPYGLTSIALAADLLDRTTSSVTSDGRAPGDPRVHCKSLSRVMRSAIVCAIAIELASREHAEGTRHIRRKLLSADSATRCSGWTRSCHRGHRGWRRSRAARRCGRSANSEGFDASRRRMEDLATRGRHEQGRLQLSSASWRHVLRIRASASIDLHPAEVARHVKVRHAPSSEDVGQVTAGCCADSAAGRGHREQHISVIDRSHRQVPANRLTVGRRRAPVRPKLPSASRRRTAQASRRPSREGGAMQSERTTSLRRPLRLSAHRPQAPPNLGLQFASPRSNSA